MENLVAGIGLSRASRYATFGDKHQLFIRALGHYWQGIRQGQRLGAPNCPAAGPGLLAASPYN